MSSNSLQFISFYHYTQTALINIEKDKTRTFNCGIVELL